MDSTLAGNQAKEIMFLTRHQESWGPAETSALPASLSVNF
jgi:hypothetical protein